MKNVPVQPVQTPPLFDGFSHLRGVWAMEMEMKVDL